MNNHPKKLIIFLVLCLIGLSSKATHIIGGEMSYRCLGNNDFEVTMLVYRDCINGVPYFDSPASIGIFDVNNVLVEELRPLVQADDTLGTYANNACLVVPPETCGHSATYRDTVNLAAISGGYNFVYQRCCRSSAVQNIFQPDSTGASYTLFISEEAISSCNNSPSYLDYPPNPICVNSPLSFSHVAIDLEGDSIVYALCSPLIGGESYGTYNCTPQPCGVRPQPPFSPPFDPIVWQPPYDVDNMTNSTLNNPPITINSSTGELTGLPNTIGSFAIGICIKEYRNGVLLSSSNRDFQYEIVNCDGPEASVNFTADFDDILPETVYFSNNSYSTNDPFISFEWDFGDGNSSTQENPTHTFNDNENYIVTLKGTTQSNCVFGYSLYLQYVVPPWADFTMTNTGNVYSFQNNSRYASVFLWDFGDGTTSTEMNPTHEFFAKNTDFNVQLIATNGKGKDTSSIIIQIPTATQELAFGEQVKLFPNPVDQGLLTIEQTGIQFEKVTVYHADGRKLLSQQLTKSPQQQLDLIEVPDGVYFIKLISEERSYSLKVVVVRS